MNKTMAIAAALLCFATAFFIIGMGDGIDGATKTINGVKYTVVTDADSVHDPAAFSLVNIYIDSETVVDGSFRDCTTIKNVVFSPNVVSVGDSAFEGCTNLSYISTNNVESIGDRAFKDTKMNNMVLTESLTSIGSYCFQGCRFLNTAALTGSGITSLPEGVFKDSELRIVDLRSIDSISPTAFEGTSVAGQILNPGQSVKLGGVPEIVMEDFRHGNILISTDVAGYKLNITVEEHVMLIRADSEGIMTVSSEYRLENKGYSCEILFDGNSITVDARTTIIHFPDYTGLEDVSRKSGEGTYTLPDGGDVSSILEYWYIDDPNSAVLTITEEMFAGMDAEIGLTAILGTFNIDFDHTALPAESRTGLIVSGSFEVGDVYPALEDISGFSFSGWLVGDSIYAPGSAITVFGDHTASSLWNATTFNISIIDGDSESESIVAGGSSLILDSIAYSEPIGKRFTGWSLSAGGDVLSSDPIITMDTTIYAVYEDRPVYTIRYVDGTTVIDTQNGYGGRTVTIDQDNPSCDGKTFQCWRLAGSETTFYKGSGIRLESDIDLIAEWAVIKVNVTYHLPVLDRTEYDWGTEITVTNDGAVRDGYELTGWSFTYEGGIDLLDGAVITITTDTELYPCWQQLGTFSVTLHGFYGQTSSSSMYKNTQYTIPDHITARTLVSFEGWSLTNGGSINYVPGDTFTVVKNTDLYEIWSDPVTFDVTLHGYNGDQTESFEFGDYFRLPDRSRDGYDFKGWSLSASGSAKYSAGDGFTVRADTDLYEIWEEIIVIPAEQSSKMINLCFKDGAAIIDRFDLEPGSSFSISDLEIPEKEGYRFVGWDSASSSVTAEYSASSILKISSDLTLYAIWEQLAVITYHLDGVDPVVCTVGSMIILETPSSTGQIFKGWSVPESANLLKGTIRVEQSMDLYPNWEAVPAQTPSTDPEPSGDPDKRPTGITDIDMGHSSGTYSGSLTSKGDNNALIIVTGAAVAAIISFLVVFQVRRN